MHFARPSSPEHDLEVEIREQAQTVTRCGLCAGRVIHEGTFAEGRVAALEHRRERHPEVKERRAKRMRSFREQSRMVVRNGKITPEITAKAVTLRSAGFTWADIAGRYWTDLGYGSKTACSTSLQRSVARFEREAKAAA
jgi:hypothetical protein